MCPPSSPKSTRSAPTVSTARQGWSAGLGCAWSSGASDAECASIARRRWWGSSDSPLSGHGLQHLPAVPISQPAHLATIRRGTALEGVIRGHVAVVDSAGSLLGAVGDPDALTTLRSCVKPVQALPLVRAAAEHHLDVSDAEVAIACASHGGEPAHVEVVLRLLGRAGLGEEALSCGPQLPMDEDSAEAILAAGGRPGRLTNNCSGKHASMLVVCAVRGLPLAGYAGFDHPLQVEIRSIMGDLAGVDLASAPVGIDGCGLPTYGLSLRALARMFAAAGRQPGFRRCQEAMAAHPHLVAGRGRVDTALLGVAGSRRTAHAGAA